MDAICVPFVIQMEGDGPPDLSGFVDPICIPARIVWLNEDGRPRTPESTSTANGEGIPGNPPPGRVGTVPYAGFNHLGEFQPVLDVLDTAKFVRGVSRLFGIPAAKAQPMAPEEEFRARFGPGGQETTPAEELRIERYARAERELRELEAQNPELQSLSTPGSIPDEALGQQSREGARTREGSAHW
jgi:hypothetical protein